MPRTQDISTTEIKQLVNALHMEKLAEIRAVMEHLQSLVNMAYQHASR